MRILHITSFCHLGSTGGTESYIKDLCIEQYRQGHSPTILWLGTRRQQSRDEDLLIVECDVSSLPLKRMKRELGDVLTAHVTEFKPTLAIIHTFDWAEGIVAEFLSSKRIPFLFIYHALSWSCRQQDYLFAGLKNSPCDGRVSFVRCLVCCQAVAHGHSLFRGCRHAALDFLKWIVLRLCRSDKMAWVQLFALRKHYWNVLCRHVHAVIACAEWSIPYLENNGIARNRIAYVPQGINSHFLPVFQANRRVIRSGVLTIGLTGRVTSIKGTDILVKAVRMLPHVDLRLEIYGCPPSSDYLTMLKHLAQDDSRVIFMPALPREQLLAKYADFDILAIPSTVRETGPLTFLEGLYSGCHVMSTPYVGFAQLLAKEGTIIKNNTAEGWADAIQDYSVNLAHWRTNNKMSTKERTMTQVSDELLALL